MSRQRKPSKQMAVLLRILAASPSEWQHGYDLMKRTGMFSGTLYPLLMRMTVQGLVEAEWREPSQRGRPARHAYRLTAEGIVVAATLESQNTTTGLACV